MINLSLDRHDFESAVEGFARGSHLRQHVWREIVYKSIPQMSDNDMVEQGKEDWWTDLSVYDNKAIFPTYT